MIAKRGRIGRNRVDRAGMLVLAGMRDDSREGSFRLLKDGGLMGMGSADATTGRPNRAGHMAGTGRR
jgi:hypothetical protein